MVSEDTCDNTTGVAGGVELRLGEDPGNNTGVAGGVELHVFRDTDDSLGVRISI